MSPIDVLEHEHRVIEQVLGALGTWADSVERGDDAPVADTVKFATFFREFADRCHHGKEEDILFVAMTRHGFSAQVGPVAVMLHEHTVGRAPRRRTRRGIDGPVPGRPRFAVTS